MQDRVADVLAQRAALDRGAGTAIALSVLLHGGITALVVYSALHAAPSQRTGMVSIQFASVEPRPAPVPAPEAGAAPQSPPKIEDVKPKIEKPKAEPPKKPEKNTVPLSPFGRSTKKGSETPPAETPKPSAPAAETSTAPQVLPGASGVAGLEGCDFPYTIYIDAMLRKIRNYWYRPQVDAGAGVVIYFRILRNGTIVDSRVETSSGNPTFDRVALSAVRSSSPLTPLPFGYDCTFLGVRQIFR